MNQSSQISPLNKAPMHVYVVQRSKTIHFFRTLRNQSKPTCTLASTRDLLPWLWAWQHECRRGPPSGRRQEQLSLACTRTPWPWPRPVWEHHERYEQGDSNINTSRFERENFLHPNSMSSTKVSIHTFRASGVQKENWKSTRNAIYTWTRTSTPFW